MTQPEVANAPQEISAKPEKGIVRRFFSRFARCAFWVAALFVLIILIGMIPVNNGFQATPDGLEIFVTSNPVHAEIVMPIESGLVNWRDRFDAECFPEDTSMATHVAVGWGDRGFFLRTPTWSDLKVSVAANALLLPSDTCVHVTMKTAVVPGSNTRRVRVSEQQYQNLVDYINATLRTDDDGSLVPIRDEHYSWNDAFFESHGTYHLLNTCNSWVGRGMQATGVRVGWLTPLPKTVFWYLPE